MVVVVRKEYELCPHPDHLGQEEVVVFVMGSDSARRKRGRMTSTRRPPVDTMAVMEYHCKRSAIIALSWVYKAMVAL